jgi:predicted DNA-binding antitoxin AbrB/MazE fold protein
MQIERMYEMLQTIWAVIHNGKIEPLEGVTFPEGAKVIVTLLPEEDEPHFWLSASETSLTEVWDNTGDDIYAKLLQK